LLYDLSSGELITGLRNATLELAIMVQPGGEQTAGIEFELLRTYPLRVAVAPAHPFARLKSIPLEKVAAEPCRKDFPEYYRNPSPHATKGDVTPVGENFAKSCGRLRMERLRPKQSPGRSLFGVTVVHSS
jgi:DNA-binding transcriptional LysR family regulator